MYLGLPVWTRSWIFVGNKMAEIDMEGVLCNEPHIGSETCKYIKTK